MPGLLGCRLVVYGKASGESALVTGDQLLFGNRTACGLAVGAVIEDEALMREAMERLAGWAEGGKLRLQIGRRYPLHDAAQAHRDLEARKTHGKLILLR